MGGWGCGWVCALGTVPPKGRMCHMGLKAVVSCLTRVLAIKHGFSERTVSISPVPSFNISKEIHSDSVKINGKPN